MERGHGDQDFRRDPVLISYLNFMTAPVEVTTVAEEPATATRSLLVEAMPGWLGATLEIPTTSIDFQDFFFFDSILGQHFQMNYQLPHSSELECCRGPFFLKQPKGNQARCLLPLYVPF